MAADPNGPYAWRNRDSDNDILRKILNWFVALGAGTRAWSTNLFVGGTAASDANPVPAEVIIGGAPNSVSNPLFVDTGVVPGASYTSSFQFTRADNAAPYTALDVVGPAPTANLEFAGIGPESTTASGQRVLITSVSLRVDAAAVPAGMSFFRLHLFNAGPTALADNAPFNIIAADRDKYQGFIDIPTPVDNGDTLWNGTEDGGFPVRKEVQLNTLGNLYGVLQTIGAYTPSALTVKTVELQSVGI